MDDLFDRDYEVFKKEVRAMLGIDLNQYKPAQMMRRIRSFISKYKCTTLAEFASLLHRTPDLLIVFKDFLTINVTEFFRNPEKFDSLKAEILPNLIQKAKEQRRPLRIWSAGCSNGSEAYTLAIIMDEYFKGQDYAILATDIDEKVMNFARVGEYRVLEVKNINKAMLSKYFDETVVGTKWKVKTEVKRNVKFTRNNLLEDTFAKGFDLILCRNVVIYFTDEAKDILYKKFHDALGDSGVLFVGGTESILNSRQIGFARHTNLFYFK